MTYDQHARRETPLAIQLKAKIRRQGPITVADYMRACLFDPVHGYYVRRTAIGAGGDFFTAPEVSQMFGELLGLWSAVAWDQMGRPRPFDLVEYGPGRGTMMADALRALTKVPACAEALRVRLVEVSPELKSIQQQRLQGLPFEITWHERLAGEVDPASTIVLANEVLDADPVRQVVNAGGGIDGERCVTLDEAGELQFCLRLRSGDVVGDREDVTEQRELHRMVAEDLVMLPQFAALLIDYGHAEGRAGDTLQAVRQHRFEHPLTSPGEADLTAQVDFTEFARQSRALGLETDGPITQGELLGALGLAERASKLMSSNPRLAGQIEAGAARLMSPTGMGTRFKAIGLRRPGQPILPGFPAVTEASARRRGSGSPTGGGTHG